MVTWQQWGERARLHEKDSVVVVVVMVVTEQVYLQLCVCRN